jgi:hypothetical protein
MVSGRHGRNPCLCQRYGRWSLYRYGGRPYAVSIMHLFSNTILTIVRWDVHWPVSQCSELECKLFKLSLFSFTDALSRIWDVVLLFVQIHKSSLFRPLIYPLSPVTILEPTRASHIYDLICLTHKYTLFHCFFCRLFGLGIDAFSSLDECLMNLMVQNHAWALEPLNFDAYTMLKLLCGRNFDLRLT